MIIQPIEMYKQAYARFFIVIQHMDLVCDRLIL
jgi:hypothetical protein